MDRIKRNPKKCKHKLTLLMIYGILMFVFQMASRREANREMKRPSFMENLKIWDGSLRCDIYEIFVGTIFAFLYLACKRYGSNSTKAIMLSL